MPNDTTARSARPAVWAFPALVAILDVATISLFVLNARVTKGDVGPYVVLWAMTAVYAGIGALIASWLPRNPIGWLLSSIGLAMALAGFAEQYGARGLITAPGSLPAVRPVAAMQNWLLPAAFASLIFVFLLFPTGRVPSQRWRFVLWAAMGVTAVAIVGNLMVRLTVSGLTNLLQDHHVDFPNPSGIASTHGPMGVVLGVAGATGVASGALAIVSLFARRRRATSEERQQLAWLGYVGLAAIVLFVASAVNGIVAASNGGWNWLNNLLFTALLLVTLLGIPLACGVAILRYRLYDLDIVVKKTVILAVLVVLFAAVYVAVVVGVGALVGKRGNGPLTFVAAALVALAFQPVRARARRLADRLVYGKRASPYEVLAEFSERVAGAYSTEDVLPQMARILAEGTGAARARVWLRIGDEMRPEASWPAANGADPQPVLIGRAQAVSLPDEGYVCPVRHQGDLLGALSVTMPPAEPITPSHEKLILDLAGQAGLVLRNVRLIEELRASRQRIVAAQDEERRRLERNIHDGAQQQLVALSVKLRLATALREKDPAKATELLDQLQGDAQDALADLRNLAHGIYPPLLSDQGLVAALSAQARRAPFPVEVEANGIARYPKETEAAVYFCCLEAMQNVGKYAGATRAAIWLSAQDGELRFSVRDDGRGFDPATTKPGAGLVNMTDRLEALGGHIEIASRPGEGTTISGRIPVTASSMS